jgi:WD40 repeat protein
MAMKKTINYSLILFFTYFYSSNFLYAKGGDVYKVIKPYNGLSVIDISNNGKFLAIGTYDNKYKGIINLTTINGKVIRKFQDHLKDICGISFSQDDKMIASVDKNQVIMIWDIQTGRKIKSIETGIIRFRRITSLAYSPRGDSIAVASNDRKIYLWGINGRLRKIYKGHRFCVNSIVFTPDGKKIISASDDKTIRIWSTEDGLIIWNIKGGLIETIDDHTRSVNVINISADGQKIVSGSSDATIRIWTIDGKLIDMIKVHSITLKSRRVEGKLLEDNLGVYAIAFSPDGKKISAVSSGDFVWLWDINGKLLWKKHIPTQPIIKFTPDGKYVIVYSASRNHLYFLYVE